MGNLLSQFCQLKFTTQFQNTTDSAVRPFDVATFNSFDKELKCFRAGTAPNFVGERKKSWIVLK
jgi:hypothetical protein